MMQRPDFCGTSFRGMRISSAPVSFGSLKKKEYFKIIGMCNQGSFDIQVLAAVYIISSWKSSFYFIHYITSFHTPVTPTVTNGASTKSFKFSECELKKVSFQKFFEGISVCEFLEIRWKRIPCLRMRNSAPRTLVSTVEVHIGSYVNFWTTYSHTAISQKNDLHLTLT